jgi:hypothetical protein
MEHLTDVELHAFFSRASKPGLHARVVRHLLTECGRCRKRAEEVVRSLGLDIDLDLLAEFEEPGTRLEVYVPMQRGCGIPTGSSIGPISL